MYRGWFTLFNPFAGGRFYKSVETRRFYMVLTHGLPN